MAVKKNSDERKSKKLVLLLDPGEMADLVRFSKLEHESMNNFVRRAIRNYCKERN